MTLISEIACHRRSAACDGSLQLDLTETQRDCLPWVAALAYFWFSCLSASLWLCEKSVCESTTRIIRSGEPQATASTVDAMDRSYWISRRDGGAERDGLQWEASLSHTNLTTLITQMGHHEGHEEHEAIRELTEQALQRSATAGGGVTLSSGGWHRTASALGVSVFLCLCE